MLLAAAHCSPDLLNLGCCAYPPHQPLSCSSHALMYTRIAKSYPQPQPQPRTQTQTQTHPDHPQQNNVVPLMAMGVGALRKELSEKSFVTGRGWGWVSGCKTALFVSLLFIQLCPATRPTYTSGSNKSPMQPDSPGQPPTFTNTPPPTPPTPTPQPPPPTPNPNPKTLNPTSHPKTSNRDARDPPVPRRLLPVAHRHSNAGGAAHRAA